MKQTLQNLKTSVSLCIFYRGNPGITMSKIHERNNKSIDLYSTLPKFWEELQEYSKNGNSHKFTYFQLNKYLFHCMKNFNLNE